MFNARVGVGDRGKEQFTVKKLKERTKKQRECKQQQESNFVGGVEGGLTASGQKYIQLLLLVVWPSKSEN